MEPVFAVEQVIHLLVEDLPCQMIRLLQHSAPELSIGIIAEILPLIDEALAPGIHHDAEEVGNLAVVLAFEMRQVEIAEVGHVKVHRRGVATLVEAVLLRSEAEGELKPGACVVRGAADLGLVPAVAEIVPAKCGV